MRRRVGREMIGDHGIDRQDDGAVRGLGLFHDPQRGRREILLRQRLADADALRMQEGVGHAAADHQRIDLADEVFQQVDLGRDLGAADDRDHRLGRRFQRLAQRVELGLHGAAGIGRQLVAEAFGRGMRAVRRRERVVDPDVAELGQFGDEGRIVLFFFLVEAGVFQAEDVAVLHRRDGLGRGLADAVVGEGDRLLDDLSPARRRPASANPWRRVPSGRPKCASRMTLPPLSEISVMVGATRSSRVASVTRPFSMGTLRSTRSSTRLPFTSTSSRVRNDFVIGGSLVPGACAARSVAAAEPGPTLGMWSRLCVASRSAAARPGHETYSSFPIATAVSAMRLEKPHSLSYQDITRTSVPFCTLVWSMWNVDECGSWLKSIETFGAVV